MQRLIVLTCVTAIADPVAAQTIDAHPRAGHPLETSHFARPIDSSRSIGYQVGGGALRRSKAEPPNPDDGTWGWDFTGGLFRRRVDLGWWHGRRYQGGTGSYKSDGPRLP